MQNSCTFTRSPPISTTPSPPIYLCIGTGVELQRQIHLRTPLCFALLYQVGAHTGPAAHVARIFQDRADTRSSVLLLAR